MGAGQDVLYWPASVPWYRSMLRLLSIRQFALIDELELEFVDGFSVITGETGAGKSLLVDVLDLLAGGRAESGLASPGADRAELSAVFEIPDNHPARRWLSDRDLEDGSSLVLRRTLPAAGSSRAWINGSPSPIGQLRELGLQLIEIHGQHEHQHLNDVRAQMDWLDRQIDPKLLEATSKAAEAWKKARHELDTLETEAGDPEKTEFLRFQLRELEALDLKPGEFAEMEAEHRRLARMDEILAAASSAVAALDGDDPPGAGTQLNRAIQALESVMEFEPEFETTRAMLEEARINLDEARQELDRQSENAEADPESLARLDRRMGKAMDLARKHGVEPDSLPGVQTRIAERIEQIDSFDDRRQELDRALDETLERWKKAAATLARARRKAAKGLTGEIGNHLQSLGMEQAALEIRIETDSPDSVSPRGHDRVEILFTANSGQPLQPLRKIASGGELSRFSLALLATGKRDDHARVRIFDEVDAGVGGETAHSVGSFLARAGVEGQAFAVTHLAQVAARADHHYRASKETRDQVTRTGVRRLDGDKRQREIARMLGSSRSERSLDHAAELLESAS